MINSLSGALPYGWIIDEDKVTQYVNKQRIITPLTWDIDPKINDEDRDRFNIEKDKLTTLHREGFCTPTTSLEVGLELINEVQNLSDLTLLLGIKLFIKTNHHYRIIVGGYTDNTGWILILSEAEEVRLAYLQDGAAIHEEIFTLEAPQVLRCAVNYDLEEEVS